MYEKCVCATKIKNKIGNRCLGKKGRALAAQRVGQNRMMPIIKDFLALGLRGVGKKVLREKELRVYGKSK